MHHCGNGFDPTQRFTSRVEDYVKYRPSYPAAVIDFLRETCGLVSSWVLADIGSGTGMSTRVFLEHGHRVYAVEPNAAMRAAAEAALGGESAFISVDGTAEATTLEAGCIDLIVAGQAFHWFDAGAAQREFRRILRPGGWVALFWNAQQYTATPFMRALEDLKTTYARDFQRYKHANVAEEHIREFFAPSPMHTFTCDNSRTLDYTELRGALASASYMPLPGDAQYAPMLQRLDDIFHAHQEDGRVEIRMETQVYAGQLSVDIPES